MAFGLTNTGGGDGDFLPLLAYNAKAGRMKVTQNVEVNGSWQKQETDITAQTPAFVFDLATIKVGWLLFKAGMAPVKALVDIGQPLPPQPGGDYGSDDKGKAIKPRQGFVMHVLGTDRVKREFASNAGTAVGAVDDLHTTYTAAPESKQGLLPVVRFTGANEVKSKHGSNYAPVFQIVHWVPRPAELATNGVGATAAAPPPVQPAPAPAPASDAWGAPPPNATGAAIGDAMPF